MFLTAVALGVLLWNVYAGHAPVADSLTAVVDDTGQSVPFIAPMLTVGMSPESVRAIEGEPVFVHDDRWEYGPSWIRFDHGVVVDWRNSPLHDLKTPHTRPSVEAAPAR